MAKFVQRDQSQLYLPPVDKRDWLPEDDLAHFVVEVVERVPMEAFVVNWCQYETVRFSVSRAIA